MEPVEQEGPGEVTGPSSWATREIAVSNLIRNQGPKLGLSRKARPKILLGHVLTTIGYDANCFGSISLMIEEVKEKEQFRQDILTSWFDLLTKLEWESQTPEVPQDIKDILERTRQRISERPWEDPETVRADFKQWNQTRNDVSRKIYSDPTLRDSVDAYNKFLARKGGSIYKLLGGNKLNAK